MARVCLVVVLVALVVAVAASPVRHLAKRSAAHLADGSSISSSIDAPVGYELLATSTADDSEDCVDACMVDYDCWFAVYTSGGTCNLYGDDTSSSSSSTPTKKAETALRVEGSSASSSEAPSGYSLLSSTDATSSEDCVEDCGAVSNCWFAVLDSDAGTCSLYGDEDSSSSSSSTPTKKKKVAKVDTRVEDSSDVEGYTYLSASTAKTVEACALLCSKQSKCGYANYNTDTDTCSLYGDKGTSSKSKSRAAIKVGDAATSSDVAGYVALSSSTASSLEACALLCSKQAKCGYANYDSSDSKCYLFGEGTSKKAAL